MSNIPPSVSIGMPIYNGARQLEAALNDLVNQNFRDIEIIISDNCSQDDTSAICKKFADRDPRIRYYRQPETISATDNFNFVLGKAQAEFFMWAAHDDTRSPDFIEKLRSALMNNPKAILAFGDIVGTRQGVADPVLLNFDNRKMSSLTRLRRTAIDQLHHLYGLWRREPLSKLEWKHNEWWHDTPPMMAASLLGDFIYVPGPVFYYLYNKHPFFDAKVNGEFIIRRSKDLVRLIYLSGEAVTRIKGPVYGLIACIFCTEKIFRDITTFITKRVRKTK